MSLKKIELDDDSVISTVDTRPSNRSDRAKVSSRAKKPANSSRAVVLRSTDFAQPLPAPKTSPYENPPHAARPTKSESETRPAMMSDMWTSIASNPASWNAHAISMCPFTPCSRRIATRGVGVEAFLTSGRNGALTSYTIPGSASSRIELNSSFAPWGSSRRACMRPQLLQLATSGGVDRLGPVDDVDRLVLPPERPADGVDMPRGEASLDERVGENRKVGRADLHDRTELLVEKGTDEVLSRPTGKGHLHESGEETTVRPVVVRQDDACGLERLHGGEERFEVGGVLHVGRVRTELLEHLSDGRTTEPLLSSREIHENEDGLAEVRVCSDLRGPRAKAVMMRESGAVTSVLSPLEPSPSCDAADIQLAESLTCERLSMEAAAKLVRASAMAMRAEAPALRRASGVRSPIAIASPTRTSKPYDARVTATSATGTCQGPTIWSRVTRPVIVLSPIVMRKDLDPTLGKRRTRLTVSARREVTGAPRSDDRERASLPLRDRLERLEVLGPNGKDVSLLRLVAPNLHRRHGRVVHENIADLKHRAEVRVVDQLGEGVGETTSADIVDRLDGVGIALVDASVDDLLASTFHLRVLSLDRGEIEVGRASATGHGTGRSTTKTDQHSRTAEHDDFGSRGDLVLASESRSDITETTGNHDRLVVTPPFVLALGGRDRHEECAEVPTEGRSTELVVERRGSEGRLDHYVKSRCDVSGPADVGFPRLDEIGDEKVRSGEACETGFGVRSSTRRAFVSDLATRPRRSTRIGGHGCRVVPSMTAALSSYAEMVPAEAINFSVFLIIPKSELSMSLPSMVHLALKILWRQCSLLTWANMNSSASVGFRPAAMNDSTRDLRVGKGETEAGVGLPQEGEGVLGTDNGHRNKLGRVRGQGREDGSAERHRRVHELCHTVVHEVEHRFEVGQVQRTRRRDEVERSTFEARDMLAKTTDLGDVRGLGRPRPDSTNDLVEPNRSLSPYARRASRIARSADEESDRTDSDAGEEGLTRCRCTASTAVTEGRADWKAERRVERRVGVMADEPGRTSMLKGRA
ncbi:LOW QUALITY PROTEIN: hypothetical protein JCM24511_06366 [Saitozyma sp. JCM 24511]|nr:LOW QUALITY PROTEIN: hypothetical protein JCM24511_06366 [Saitozyma sp. JCM 24511]